MKNLLWISAMIVMAALLASSPFAGFAAESATVEHLAAANVSSPEQGTTWVCVYQPERAVGGGSPYYRGRSAYYRGRAGQLETRTVEPEVSKTGRLNCKAASGDMVMLFKQCQL